MESNENHPEKNKDLKDYVKKKNTARIEISQRDKKGIQLIMNVMNSDNVTEADYSLLGKYFSSNEFEGSLKTILISILTEDINISRLLKVINSVLLISNTSTRKSEFKLTILNKMNQIANLVEKYPEISTTEVKNFVQYWAPRLVSDQIYVLLFATIKKTEPLKSIPFMVGHPHHSVKPGFVDCNFSFKIIIYSFIPYTSLLRCPSFRI